MTNIASIEDAKLLKILNAFPKKYTIEVTRDMSTFSALSGWVEESVTWKIKDKTLDNEYGDVLVFNHLLMILESYINGSDANKNEFLKFIESIGDANDRNFNK